MTWLLYPAVAISLAIIALLWHGDPKRRRTIGLRDKADGSGKRRALAAIALVPGLVLAVLGDSAAFLVWFGACAIAGWLVAQVRVRA
ncbi:hypothetical protein [Novosphingobium sp. JCM 18896]|uniref:hypothetical protein n=1 Tax=Novosphingobium sp. JCM 18896 TaxID=2989731 RepID=UPI0022219101|nr:hypothetical protein [Novosphingobium sp. JCM 18896]MCW1429811.1 hypothetical protein [Novosphingobium sp. JCM 18896]